MSSKLGRVVLLVALCAGAAPAAAGSGKTVLRPGFGTLRVGHGALKLDVDARKSNLPGQKRCALNDKYVSGAPAVQFEVAADTRFELRVSGKLGGQDQLLIVPPSGDVECLHLDKRVSRVWGKGSWKVYFSGTMEQIPAGTFTLNLFEIAPAKAKLPETLSPNPMSIGKLRHDERRTRTTCNTADFSVMSTDEAALMLELAKPRKHLRFSGGPGVKGLVITDSAGRARCYQDGTFVDVKDLPAGAVAVRIADGGGGWAELTSRDADQQFSILVEDLEQPRTPDWPQDVQVVDVTGALAAPVILVGPPQPKREPGYGACNVVAFPARPTAMLKLDRPRKDLTFRVASTVETRLRLVGPIGDDNRLAKDHLDNCLDPASTRKNVFPPLEPGRYFVYAGVATGSDPGSVALIIGDAATAEDPLAIVGKPPAAPKAVEARAILPWFAMAPTKHGVPTGGAELLQGLFMAAPLDHVVYARFDMDDAAAAAWNSGALEEAKLPVEYPRKDEPLLVLGPGPSKDSLLVLSADAVLFVTSPKYLTTTASGAPVLPKAPRNVVLDWDDARRIATGKDKKLVDTAEAARVKADACYSAYWDKHHGAVDPGTEYIKVTYVNGRVVSVSSYTDEVHAAAVKKCGYAKVEALQAKAFKSVDKSYRKLLADGLAKIATRLAGA